ncbi:Piso0_000274 [Millerozyma farinosa CBS 7064]|uniref:Piso0_000274 protein n=1 Tax=Pichia sorbitophila (strain ATCC MYA-4447 / BCRC 22081 / CBS 7064 / NBRC 10061 / NRRL Y-12695) TaxID=559304 RepID=G8YTJ3_PICSO|nr:Piso0_000274 [Millerozyma farinosa CBS 7064]
MVELFQEKVEGGLLYLLLCVSSFIVLLLIYLAYRLLASACIKNAYRPIGADAESAVSSEYLLSEEALTNLAEEFDYDLLPPEERTSYLRGEEFTKAYPPEFHSRGRSYNDSMLRLVKEHGVSAFEFEQENDILQARYLVSGGTEVHFLNNDAPYSTATAVLNYSLPVKNRGFSDTIYFEVKVFEFTNDNPSSHFSIGLVTKPYPSKFRLPGYNSFSISYESTGNLKINRPFPTPSQQHQGDASKFNSLVLPPLEQSDIVGFGYHIPTGIIFITRNGNKLLDVMKGCYLDLYPAIGCFSTNAKFQANLGQLGFVWVEANVRKYGFISTTDFEKIRGEIGLAALPEYGKFGSSELLEKGEELPPEYPEDEIDFFGRSSNDVVRVGSSSKNNRAVGLEVNDEKYKATKSNKEGSIEPKGSVTCFSPRVTNEPPEIMDFRERLYEQNISKKDTEETPLIAEAPDILNAYHSTSKKEPTPLLNSENSNHVRRSQSPALSGDSKTSPSNDPPTVPSSSSKPSKKKKNKKKSSKKKKN